MANPLMKKIKASIMKSTILKSLIISLLAFFLSYGLYYGFRDYLIYIGIDSSNLSYLKTFYNNRNQSDRLYEPDNIFILCVEDDTPRDSIGRIINKVFTYKPKVVGIDILFKSNYDSCNFKLKDAIYQHADSIVLAQVIGNNNSFIFNLFTGDSLQFGIVNSYDVLDYPDSFIIDNKTYHHFAYEIALRFNSNLNLNKDQFLINYSNTHFINTDVDNFYNDPDSLNQKRINNNIVLIGNSENLFDIHPMPFVIDGNEALSGIERHAYAINSLISPHFAMRRLSEISLLNLFLFFLQSFFYSIIYVLLTDEKSKNVKKHPSLFNIIRPIVLLIIVPILLLGYYLYTSKRYIVPNVVPFLLTVFIINTFNDFISQNINPNKHE